MNGSNNESQRWFARLLPWAKVALLLLFLFSTNHGVVDRVERLSHAGNWLGTAVFLSVWAIALASIAIAAWLPSLWWRVGWALPLAISACLGDLNYSVANDHLSFFDVVLYWAERPHWGDAAVTYSTWLLPALLKAACGLAGMALPPGKLAVPRWLAPAPIVSFVVVCALLVVLDGKGTAGLPSQHNAVSMVAVMFLTNPMGDLSSTRSPVEIQAGAALEDRIVLIVDEAVRADFIDLNGARGVTPTLLEHADRIANFGYAVSGNNCSLFSNLTLRFGGHPDHLAESLRTGPSIWSYARHAGYRTVYIDGQKVEGGLQNGMNMSELREIDEFIQPYDVNRTERDVFIAAELREMLKRDERIFVYVNKKGTHFPYRANYPDEAALFKPDMSRAEPIGRSREHLLNSYRNSIRWNTDRFFRELLRDGVPDATFIYTADHGQNLMDRGVMLQCGSTNPHEFEGLVPLFAISGDAALEERFKLAAEMQLDRATHFQIFATLLELMGYEHAALRDRFPRGLLDGVSDQALRFSYGPIVGVSDQEVRWREMPPNLRDLAR